jgi:hypothetical protein
MKKTQRSKKMMLLKTLLLGLLMLWKGLKSQKTRRKRKN